MMIDGCLMASEDTVYLAISGHIGGTICSYHLAMICHDWGHDGQPMGRRSTMAARMQLSSG